MTPALRRLVLLAASAAALSLAARGTTPALVRGPYLQSASARGVKIVCKTDVDAELVLRFGEHSGPPWTGARTSPAGTTHVFELDLLRPDTRYRYQIAAGTRRLAGGEDCTFRTAPPDDARAPFRFLAWGDAGSGRPGQFALAARMDVLPEPSFVLGLGDLVYQDGEWEHYDPRLFRPYAPLFRDATFWPAFGNHDARTQAGAPYFDAFHLPTGSGAPGHPSGTERYYSFDHGMAHFACVDSESTSTAPGSPQYRWLEDDLEHARARGARWIFVFMHHPPYSHGTHDSTLEPELIQLRQNLVPLLEEKGVDMVLVGHSHGYERSHLARGGAVLQPDPSAYTKIGSPDGTLYLVTGCAGKHSKSGTYDHPLMARSSGGIMGFNVIDVGWDVLQGRFVEEDGRTTDLFTLRKEADSAPPGVAALAARVGDRVAVVFDEAVRAGAGAGGSEDAARYALDPPASVLAATLQDDGRTVVLSTAPLAPDRAYTLDVQGVADPGGRSAHRRARFVRPRDESLSGIPLVPRGATWRYRKGTSDPGSGWASPGFDDAGWSSGPAGFGYGDGDDATVLGDMRDRYATVFARVRFGVPTPELVRSLYLGVSYDDGFVAYLNGREVARVNVPVGESHGTLAQRSHEGDATEWFDVGAARDGLVAGTNVLAISGHNTTRNSNDFSLHAELRAVLGRAAGQPRAVLEAPVRVANAPALLSFSGARSTDDQGAPVSWSWDFGDGGARASGPAVERSFPNPGLYDVTLVVRDQDGQESLARVPVRIHADGLAPIAQASASAAQIPRGSRVRFDAGASRDPDGGPVTLHWDFGDPTSGRRNVSSFDAPLHRYLNPGLYTATLVVTDDEGSGAVARVSIRVD